MDKQSIVDHFERAQFFIQVADSIPFDSEVNEKRKCWFYLAAVYSLRAAWEITKKGIEEKLIVGDAESFKEETKKVVSYYDTVDRIRIQDYHVHGIRLKRGAGCALGKTTMSTGNSPSGSAAFFLTPEGPQIIKEKSGFVKQERPVSACRPIAVAIEAAGGLVDRQHLEIAYAERDATKALGLRADEPHHPRVGAVRANGFDAHRLIELRPRKNLPRYNLSCMFHGFPYSRMMVFTQESSKLRHWLSSNLCLELSGPWGG